ncbi:hypothetical protein EDB80DRAFT_590091, partial [Ilyonectria destructans]
YYIITEEFKNKRASFTILVYFSTIYSLVLSNSNKYIQLYQFTSILIRLIYYI